MFYKNLILNQKFFNLIKNYHKNDKIPHAILIHGQKGIGKQGHAIELAALLNCTNKTNYESCGSCHSCIQLKSMQHPNIHFIVPYPKRNSLSKNDHPEKALSNKDIEILIELKKNKILNPYSDFNIKNANTILINSIRFLKKELYNTSIEDGWKIILIFDAEKLCIPGPESANSLLKVLEEPPNKTIFILVSNDFDKIIKTIKSRCQTIYFPKLSFEKIRKNISSEKIDSKMLKIYIKIFDGNFYLINKNINNVDNFNKKINKILNYLMGCNINDQKTISMEQLNLEKSNWNEFMKLFIIIFRDLEILLSQSENSNLYLNNFLDTYKKIILKYSNANWSNCIASIEKTNLIINQNVYFPLILNTLHIEIKKNLNNQPIKTFIT